MLIINFPWYVRVREVDKVVFYDCSLDIVVAHDRVSLVDKLMTLWCSDRIMFTAIETANYANWRFGFFVSR